MQTITFYFKGHSLGYKCAISDWYCKPSILRCLALKTGALFIISSKYGCRQFAPDFSKFYPIYMFWFRHYKNGLPWITIEFDESSSIESFKPETFLSTFIEYL